MGLLRAHDSSTRQASRPPLRGRPRCGAWSSRERESRRLRATAVMTVASHEREKQFTLLIRSRERHSHAPSLAWAHAGADCHACPRGARRTSRRGRGAPPGRGACVRDRRSRRPRVPGGEGARPQRNRLRRARVADSADHGQSRSRRTAQGGLGFDLPIALSILAASGQIPRDRLAEHAAVGELALDGRLRPVGGMLALAEAARRAGLSRILCAARSAPEAALAGIEPVPVRHLAEAAAYLRGEREPEPYVEPERPAAAEQPCPISPTSAARSGRGARSRSRPRAGTTSCSPARRARARRCSLGGCRGSCRRSRPREALEVTRIHSVAGHARGRPAARHGAAAPLAALQRVGGRARRRRARGRGRARSASRTAACSFSTSSPSSSGRRSRRCASRSRTASSASRASAGGRSSRLASSSSRR